MSIKYRSEIDGLRAIAVLLVIFNHLGVNYFSGGFVGVDIFFVISGFLITSIIKQEIEENNFSFGNFYKKRVLRLAPAYFLVLAVTTIVMSFLAAPNDFMAYIKSALYSSGFIANIYMWQNLGGYFSSSANMTPLLHLWSLGIEEQFYLIWPIVLILLTKFIPKFRFILIIIAIILSIVVSQIIANIAPSIAYFLLPFRAFELLIGAAIAFIPIRKNSLVCSNLASILGLALIIYSALTFSEKTVFPGVNALLPCLGTALIIYFCRDGIIQKALSIKPMNFIGKISYPLYLWHWPLIVFLNYYYIEINFLVGTLTFILTLLLSWLTFEFVEKKFIKYKTSKTSNVILKGYGVPLSITIICSLLVFNLNGIPQRFSQSLLEKDAAIFSKSDEIRAACIDGGAKNLPDPENCKLGVEKDEIDLLLIGDSHANHFAPMIDVFTKDANLRGFDITQNSTLFLPHLDRYSMLDKKEILASKFKSRNDELINHLSTHKYKYVVLAGSYADSYTASVFKSKDSNILGNSVFLKGVKESIELVYKNGAKPVLIVGSPKIKNYDQTCPLRKEMYGLSINCDISRLEHDAHFAKWKKDIEIVKEAYPDLIVIDPPAVMCNVEKCFTELKGIPLYKDIGHLNSVGAALIGELYLEEYGNPLKDI